MKKISWLLAMTLAVSTISACSGGSENEIAYVQSVGEICGLGAVGIMERFAGVVTPKSETEIQKSQEEPVAEVKVKQGDTVTKDQVLFVYDTEQMKINMEKAKLELAQLKNSIAIKQKEKAALEKEKANAGSDQQLSYTLEIQSADAEIMETQYNISVKEKELEKMQTTLNALEVKSPVDGIVQSINEKGETDDYGNPLPYMTIVETGTYRVKGYINENNVAALGEGTAVEIQSRIDDAKWQGTISSIDLDNPVQPQNQFSNSSDEETVSSSKYAFYVELTEDEGLMMGQHVYIQTGSTPVSEGADLMLPSYFINDVDTEPWVWAQNTRGKLEKRKIVLGDYLEETDSYCITEGLTAEDYLAFPDEMLKEGMSCSGEMEVTE